jgi:ABC-type glycerol-3-phosphate transport system permease component
MDAPRELVDAATTGAVLATLSGLAALVAVGAGYVGSRVSRPGSRRTALTARRISLLAAVVVVVYPLWVIYNGIENYFGLDSVAALLLNLALFVLVGVAGGRLLRSRWPEDAEEVDGEPEAGA